VFKGLSEDGGGQNSLKNLRTSPFNKDLSNEISFSRSISLGSTFNSINSRMPTFFLRQNEDIPGDQN
jgi:hypothetical protein